MTVWSEYKEKLNEERTEAFRLKMLEKEEDRKKEEEIEERRRKREEDLEKEREEERRKADEAYEEVRREVEEEKSRKREEEERKKRVEDGRKEEEEKSRERDEIMEKVRVSAKRNTTSSSIGQTVHHKQARLSEDSPSSTDNEDDETVSLPSQERDMSRSGSGSDTIPPQLNSTEIETESLVEVTIETNRMSPASQTDLLNTSVGDIRGLFKNKSGDDSILSTLSPNQLNADHHLHDNSGVIISTKEDKQARKKLDRAAKKEKNRLEKENKKKKEDKENEKVPNRKENNKSPVDRRNGVGG